MLHGMDSWPELNKLITGQWCVYVSCKTGTYDLLDMFSSTLGLVALGLWACTSLGLCESLIPMLQLLHTYIYIRTLNSAGSYEVVKRMK